jgi:peptide/nickel transport system permease protein
LGVVEAQDVHASAGLRTRTSSTEAPGRRALKRFLHHRAALLGSLMIVIMAVSAIFAGQLVGDPDAIDFISARAGPSGAHLLGTDQIGRDVLARVIYGARISLTVGLLAVSAYVLLGTVFGALAGYYGGWTDAIIMRFTDVVLAYPALVVVLAVVAIVGQNLGNIIFVIALLGWPPIARLVRSSFLSLREEEYVQAARVIGASNTRIISRYILPGVAGPLVVAGTFGMAGAILLEAALSFLGVGIQPPTASWGNMLTDAQSLTVLETMPWLWAPPGVAIALAVLSINFIGDGLRDALDPRVQPRF